MRQAAPVIAFLLLIVTALSAWLWSAGTGSAVPIEAFVAVPSGREPLADVSLDGLRERARSVGCAQSERLWWEVVRREADDLEAYKALAECGRGEQIDAVVADAAGLFEESPVLAMVPALLDMLEVRDLVPILNEVQAGSSDAADLRRIGELRRALGDVGGAVAALQQALVLDPRDAESHVQLGYALVDSGRVDEAREAFRNALATEPAALRMTRVYAMAVAWPMPFGALLLGLVGLTSTLATRQGGLSAIIGDPRTGDTRGDVVVVAAVMLAITSLAGWFAITADRMAFGLLLVIAISCAAWLAISPLWAFLRRSAEARTAVPGQLVVGRIQHAVAQLPPWAQLAIVAGSGLTLVLFVPLVSSLSVRLGVGTGVAIVLFSTLGTLSLRWLDRARSLRSALRWLGLAGTLPFLLFFLYFERESMTDALFSGTFIDRDAQNRIAAYLLVWMGGLALAGLLSRILAQSILGPLDRVLGTLERVRGGDLDVHLELGRQDEIGRLGAAVEEMAGGLRQRAEMRETFRRYVDPELAELLLRNDPSVRKGRLIHATVLFSDVRGFTTLSERLEPGQVVDILNEYFARMEPIVRRWGGVVDKFLGDGMLAVWDVPNPRKVGPLAGIPGERLAVEAGAEMLSALESFNDELGMRGLPRLAIGVGVNAGELIAGPVGSRDRQEYTVIGDTVNTAQRVEGQARGDAPLLVTEAVANVIRPWVELEARDPVALKGKVDAVALFRVVRITEGVAAAWQAPEHPPHGPAGGPLSAPAVPGSSASGPSVDG